MNNILRSRLVRQLSPALIVVAVFLLAGLAGAAWFGSFDSLRAFLRGDLLAIQPQVINIGTVEWGTVLDPKVRVSNLTSRPIRIQGAIGDCPCMSPPPSLPLEVPPFGTRDLDLRVRAVGATGEGGNGPMKHSLELYLDTPGPEVEISVRGTLYGAENHTCKPSPDAGQMHLIGQAIASQAIAPSVPGAPAWAQAAVDLRIAALGASALSPDAR